MLTATFQWSPNVIRKTAKAFYRHASNYGRGYVSDTKHVEQILRETWWFLFVPLYTRDTITNTNM